MYAAAVIAAAASLAGCSGAQNASTPRTLAGVQQPPAPPLEVHKRLGLISRGGEMKSFSEAVGLILITDKQYDRFIDPQVTGSDRAAALELLKLMPANKRGDFVYVNKQSRVLSNRVELGRQVRFLQQGDAALPPTIPRQREGARRATRSYPPVGGSGGSYIRHYSAQGVNAALGYATVPCDAQLQGNDIGFMYFNSYTAYPGGSIVDGGLRVDTSRTAQAFLKFYNEITNRYYGWNYNDNYRWGCGSPIGMLYGTIGQTGKSVLMVGKADYDPRIYRLPPNATRWTNALWNFYDTPPLLSSGPGLWHGRSSPCTGCSVAKMFTISPASNPNYTSCFGLCGLPQNPTGRWDQVFMGQLTQPCRQVSSTGATCGIEFFQDNSWYGGVDVGADIFTGFSISLNDINYGLEGLAIGRNVARQDYQPPDGTFLDPLRDPPPCAPDSYSACGYYWYISMTTCDPGDGNLVSYPAFWYYTGYSDITGQIGSFQGSQYPISGECSPTWMQMVVTWSGDPQTFYNDPNLPGPYDGPPY